MHCISLAILSRLSRFPSPAVGTNWPICVDVPLKHQSINQSWRFCVLHYLFTFKLVTAFNVWNGIIKRAMKFSWPITNSPILSCCEAMCLYLTFSGMMVVTNSFVFRMAVVQCLLVVHNMDGALDLVIHILHFRKGWFRVCV